MSTEHAGPAGVLTSGQDDLRSSQTSRTATVVEHLKVTESTASVKVASLQVRGVFAGQDDDRQPNPPTAAGVSSGVSPTGAETAQPRAS